MGLLTASVIKIKRKRRIVKSTLFSVLVLAIALPLPSLLQLDMFQPVAAAGAPTITGVSPASGPVAGGQTVTISGTNFFEGKTVTNVSAGNSHTCAVADGKAYCWGAGGGLLGNDPASNSNTPVAVQASNSADALYNKTVTSVSTRTSHTCAVADGKVYCWGNNFFGQLGNPSVSNSNTPVAVQASNSADALYNKTVTSVSVGSVHTCAVADGAVYCWGSGSGGQFGNGGTASSDVPVAVDSSDVLDGKTVTSVSVGYSHTCAVADGKVYCWGAGSYGRLGDGTTTQRLYPVAVQASAPTDALYGKTVTNVSAGNSHTCAVADGKAYCWGAGGNGRLGNDGTTNSNVPVAVKANTSGDALHGKTVTSVSAGENHTCAVADGATYCWGAGSYGRLGNDGTTNSNVPVAVKANTSGDALHGKTVTSVSAGVNHTCAVAVGEAHCWGDNTYGQLGDGTTAQQIVPIAVSQGDLPSDSPSITFDGLPATSVTYVSPTQLTAVTPAHAAGVVDVVVTNPDSQVATLANSYTYVAPVVVPGAPTGLSTTPADGGVALSWTAPSNDGGAAITDYVIEYSSNGGSTWQTFSHTPSSATSATVTGLSTGITYTFRVSAVNSAGTGAPSATATGEIIYITVSSSASVAVSVTPTTASRMSSASHNVLTSTNAPSGYTLSLAMDGTNRNLVNGSQTVGPASGSLTTPAALGVNTWGFRIAGAGGFGAGGTTETNVANSAYTWAGVPASSAPVTIRTTAAAAQNSSTTVWYGMTAASTKPAGTYSGSVVYTAVAN